MTIRQSDVDLLNGYCNGSLTDTEFSALESRLRASRELRQLLIEYRSIESALSSAVVSGETEQAESSAKVKLRTIRQLRIAVLATAAGFILMCGLYFLRSSSERQIATVTSLSGSVRWIGPRGKIHDDLRVGSELTGGTVEGLSADASATIEFADGSMVTVSDLSALTMAHDEQNQLYLQHGNLSLTVEPQPHGKPLSLLTPTANLEAGETRCEISADSNLTKLTVNEGRVRMTQLVDGQSTDVSAAHQVVSTIDGRGTLAARKVLPPSHKWLGNLQLDVRRGKWLSAERVHGLETRNAIARFQLTAEEATAQFTQRVGDLGDDGGVVFAAPVRWDRDVAYMILVDASGGQSGPIVLVEGNRLRIRGSVQQPAEVTFGFQASGPAHGSDHHATERIEGAFDFVLPVDEFPLVQDSSGATGASPFGRRLDHVFCFTDSSDAGLQLTHVELSPPE